MKRSLLLLLALILLVGCGKNADKPVAKPAQPETRKNDSADFITENFLTDQAAKRSLVRQQINAFRKAAVVDRKQIQKMVNQRKGELMKLKQSINNSNRLTAAQKDSLILPLEEEATELVEDLIAVAK